MSSTYTTPSKNYHQNILELGSPTLLDCLPSRSYRFAVSSQTGDPSSRFGFGHESSISTENWMAKFSGNDPDLGSWSLDFPEEQTITTVNPKETILGFNSDHTFPPIMLDNDIPPQLPVPSFPPILSSLENVVPSPTLQSIDYEKCADGISLGLDIDIRENRVVPARRFTCTRKCGDSECTLTFASKSILSRHCRKRREACVDCGSVILCQNMARHRKICGAR